MKILENCLPTFRHNKREGETNSEKKFFFFFLIRGKGCDLKSKKENLNSRFLLLDISILTTQRMNGT